MSNLNTMTVITGGKRVLKSGVTTGSIQSAQSAFHTTLKQAWVTASDLTLAVHTHYLSQEQVAVHKNKGDDSLIIGMAKILFDGNRGMWTAFRASTKKICGLDITVEDILEGSEFKGVAFTVEVNKDVARATVLDNAEALLTKLEKEGLKSIYGPSERAPKQGANKKKKDASTAASDPADVPIAMVAVESMPELKAVLEQHAGDDTLVKYGASIAKMIDLISKLSSEDGHFVVEQLNSVTKKMENCLSSRLARKMAASAKPKAEEQAAA